MTDNNTSEILNTIRETQSARNIQGIIFNPLITLMAPIVSQDFTYKKYQTLEQYSSNLEVPHERIVKSYKPEKTAKLQ